MMARLAAGFVVVVVIVACKAANVPPHAGRVGPALTAMLGVADRTRAAWRCSGVRTLAPDAGLGEWEVRSGTLRKKSAAEAQLVIGVVADAAGSSPRTLASLKRLRSALERAGVGLVVSLGGMGTTQAEISATVGALMGPWPVVALPGDLESMSAHVAAVAELRARGATVIDGRGLRTIETPEAMLVVIPGVGSAYRSVAGSDSCVWTAGDVAQSHRDLSAYPGLRIAVSAEGPRALVDEEPTGEVALAPRVPVDIVVHGPTHTAPTPDARGGRDGAKISLSPGSADATTRLPPTTSTAAALLVLRDKAWEWQAIIDSSRQADRK